MTKINIFNWQMVALDETMQRDWLDVPFLRFLGDQSAHIYIEL